MGLSRIEQKVWIIKKEAVRGTAEASAASGRSLPLLPSAEMSLNPNLIANPKIYGDPQERKAAGGVRDWSGTFELQPSADKLGEFFMSLLGAVATDQPDAGGAPLVFRHRFTPADNSGQHPMYTVFGDRQAEQKKYGGTAVGQMAFTVPVDGRIACSADLMAKSEAAGAVLTPDFSADLEDLIFSDCTVEVAGVASSLVRQAAVTLNGNAVRRRVLAASRDAADIVHGPLMIGGSFLLYYEDGTERTKFVGDTTSSLTIKAEGQVLQAAQKASLILEMPLIKYSAGPVEEVDGILVQNFSFGAYRDPTAGYSVRATLINKETGY